MLIFSQNGQLLIFRPTFGEIAQLRAIFGSNIVKGVAESWVEAKMSWVEVDGAGRSWVELDARFSNSQSFLLTVNYIH